MLKKLIIFIFIAAFLIQGAASLDAAVDAKTAKKVSKLMVKGNKALNKKDIVKAEKYFNEVVTLDPAYAPGYYAIANIYIAKKDLMKALEMLKKTIELDKNYAKGVKTYLDLLAHFAQEHRKKKEIDKAIEYYKTIVAVHGAENVNPKLFMYACYNAGERAFNKKDYKACETFLKKILNHPKAKTDSLKLFTLSHYILGLNAIVQKDGENGRKYLEEYIKLTSNDPKDVFALRAYIILGNHFFDELNSKVEKIKKASEQEKAKNKGKKVKETPLMDKISAEAKNYMFLLKYADDMLKMSPDNMDGLILKGNVNYFMGNFEKSLEVYNRLLEKHPTPENQNSYNPLIKEIKERLAKKNKKK